MFKARIIWTAFGIVFFLIAVIFAAPYGGICIFLTSLPVLLAFLLVILSVEPQNGERNIEGFSFVFSAIYVALILYNVTSGSGIMLMFNPVGVLSALFSGHYIVALFGIGLFFAPYFLLPPDFRKKVFFCMKSLFSENVVFDFSSFAIFTVRVVILVALVMLFYFISVVLVIGAFIYYFVRFIIHAVKAVTNGGNSACFSDDSSSGYDISDDSSSGCDIIVSPDNESKSISVVSEENSPHRSEEYITLTSFCFGPGRKIRPADPKDTLPQRSHNKKS